MGTSHTRLYAATVLGAGFELLPSHRQLGLHCGRHCALNSPLLLCRPTIDRNCSAAPPPSHGASAFCAQARGVLTTVAAPGHSTACGSRMRAAGLAVAFAAWLACSARSDPPAAEASERRHLGDAPAWAGDSTGLNNAATRQRIHDEYKRHAETASNLWNMREAA